MTIISYMTYLKLRDSEIVIWLSTSIAMVVYLTRVWLLLDIVVCLLPRSIAIIDICYILFCYIIIINGYALFRTLG